jgi:NAD(P)-dependent dehydrogenase (short-subunit alcohol dehydrogenase family)
MTEELKGQLAVVTGAARGIGAAISRRLSSMGATVILASRDTTRLQQVQQEIASTRGTAHTAELDLLNESSITALAKTIETQYGRCDILINNAGIAYAGKPLIEMPSADWDTLMETNLRGPYLMVRALAPLMIRARSGHIVNISSLAGHNPLPNGAAYAASKWGLNGLTYSVAEELRPHNIRVSVVAPGSVNTGFSHSNKDPDKKLQPEDVAQVVAMLVTQAPQSFVSEVLMRPTQKP